MTRQRLYLETMEHILSSNEKTIIDTGKQGPGVIPYLPLNDLGKSSKLPESGSAAGGKQ